MDKELEQQWNRVVRRRDAMLTELGRWSPAELSTAPAKGKWSALEVVDHLARTDREVLRMTEAARGSRHAVGVRDRVRALMVRGVMWLPTRVAIPKPVEAQVTPKSCGGLSELREEWEQVDTALYTFIAGLTDEERRLGIARHPVSGWLDARAGLRFLESHLAHHGYQIARIRRAVRKGS